MWTVNLNLYLDRNNWNYYRKVFSRGAARRWRGRTASGRQIPSSTNCDRSPFFYRRKQLPEFRSYINEVQPCVSHETTVSREYEAASRSLGSQGPEVFVEPTTSPRSRSPEPTTPSHKSGSPVQPVCRGRPGSSSAGPCDHTEGRIAVVLEEDEDNAVSV